MKRDQSKQWVLIVGLKLMGLATGLLPVGLVLVLLCQFFKVSSMTPWLALGAMMGALAGIVGQILCLFGTQSPSTRMKMGTALLLLLTAPRTDGLIALLLGLTGVTAYALGLNGLGHDLDSESARRSLRQVLLYFLIALGALGAETLGGASSSISEILVDAFFCLATGRLSYTFFLLAGSAYNRLCEGRQTDDGETGLQRY